MSAPHPAPGAVLTIGASSAAAVLGLSPFESPLDVWMRLTGRVSGKAENGVLLRGQLLEPGLRAWYDTEVGGGVIAGPTLAEPGWRVSEFVHARPDAWRPVEGGCVTGEIKSVNHYAHRAKWGDGVPVWYLVQALVQMAAQHPDGLRVVSCDLVAYVTDSDAPTIYPIERDERRQGAIVERLDRFMRDHVIADRPPEPRTEAERLALLSVLAPTDEWVEPTAEDLALVEQLREGRRMEKEGKAKAEAARDAIALRVGTAAGLRGLVRGSKPSARTTVDGKALKKAHPDVYARFARSGAPSRSWRLIDDGNDSTNEE